MPKKPRGLKKISIADSIVIIRCRSCYSKNLKEIISLGNLYLSDFVKTNKKPKSFPLVLVLCKKCHLLQQAHTTPQNLLYTNRYGYKSGVNETMRTELSGISRESLMKVNKSKKKIIAVDIGANDGTLLSFYPKKVFKISVEPIKKFAKESKKYSDKVINDFFTFEAYSKQAKSLKADIVTAISCFYDIPNPNEFVSDVKKIMKENGIFVIQQNYLVSMLRQNAFDNIVHEHLEYYSLLSLTNLLDKHGLEVFDVELRDLNGGSFRTYISFKNKRKISKKVLKMRLIEKKFNLNQKKIYLDFAKRIRENKKELVTLIKKLDKQNKKIYLYGASTRGNTLLQYLGLNNKYIKYAVERNPEKYGKIISSVGIPIISEKQARIDNPDYMLVLPWFFKKEFLKREKNYIKKGGHFIFPLPKLEVV